jgi:hypothetical protein
MPDTSHNKQGSAEGQPGLEVHEIRLREDLIKPQMQSETSVRIGIWQSWVRPPIKELRDFLLPFVEALKLDKDDEERINRINTNIEKCISLLRATSYALKGASASIKGNEVPLDMMTKFAIAHNVEQVSIATDGFVGQLSKAGQRLKEAQPNNASIAGAAVAALDAAAKGYGSAARSYVDRGFLVTGLEAIKFASEVLKEVLGEQ